MRTALRPFGKRLFVRLAFVFGGALLVSFTFVTLMSILPLRRVVEAEAKEDLHWAAERRLKDVQRFLQARCSEVSVWAALLEGEPLEPGRIQPRLARILQEAGRSGAAGYLRVIVRDSGGTTVAGAGSVPGLAVELPRTGAKPDGGCTVQLKPQGLPIVLVSAPLGGAEQGVLFAAVEWEKFAELLRAARIERIEQSASAFLMLLDQQGRLLVGPPMSAPVDAAVAVLQAVEPGAVQSVTLRGAGRFFATIVEAPPSPGVTGLQVAALRSVGSAHSGGGGFERALLAALLGLLLAGSLSFGIARDLSRRLDRLAEGTRRLAAGSDLTPLSDAHDDEIGDLARAFDQMAAKVGRVRADLEEAVKRRTAELEAKTTALDHALKEARSADHAKSQFLANVSHEIRTPLNGILGLTALALDGDLPEDVRGQLALVKSSADSLLALVNDILDVSRIETRRLTLEPIPFRMRASIEEALSHLYPRAVQKGLEIECRVAPGVPDELVGDPGRLRQVVSSLVGNAIKFTEKGRVDIEVEEGGSGPDGLTIAFAVRDTGIGIPRDKQAMIFEPFTQADGSSTRRYGGVGLGLSIATRLVEMMHGKLWVESEPGRGSTFRFTARFAKPAPARAAAPAPAHGLRGLKALVVDDNDINRRLLESRLGGWGMRVEAVPGGEAGFGRLREAAAAGHPFDVALIDMQMPDVDGFTLAERVRADRAVAGTHLLLLTSAGQRGDAARCRTIGVEAYLTKPAPEVELREALSAIVSRRADRRPAELVTRHALREGRPPAFQPGVTNPGLTISGIQRAAAATAAAREGGPPAVDPNDLLRRVDGDHALLSELARAFLSTAPQQMAAIGQALERGEGAAFLRAVHSLKGSVATFGAGAAMRAAGRVAALGDAGDLAGARAACGELGVEVERLGRALTPYVRGNG